MGDVFDWDLFLKIVLAVITLGGGAIGYFVKGLRARLKDIEERHAVFEKEIKEELDDKVDDTKHSLGEIRDRMTEIDSRVSNSPTRDEMHQLALNLSGLSGDMKQLSQSIKEISRIVSRVDTYLMESAKR